VRTAQTAPATDPEPKESLQAFLSEIGKFDLLTAADEVRLSKRIEAGDPEATRELVEMKSPARRLDLQRYQHQGLPLLDLIQEGTIGLVRAAEKFDWRKGSSSPRTRPWWIRQAVERGIANKGRTIRIPSMYSTGGTGSFAASGNLRGELGREPSDDEIALDLEMNLGEVQSIRRTSQVPVSLPTASARTATQSSATSSRMRTRRLRRIPQTRTSARLTFTASCRHSTSAHDASSKCVSGSRARSSVARTDWRRVQP